MMSVAVLTGPPWVGLFTPRLWRCPTLRTAGLVHNPLAARGLSALLPARGWRVAHGWSRAVSRTDSRGGSLAVSGGEIGARQSAPSSVLAQCTGLLPTPARSRAEVEGEERSGQAPRRARPEEGGQEQRAAGALEQRPLVDRWLRHGSRVATPREWNPSI